MHDPIDSTAQRARFDARRALLTVDLVTAGAAFALLWTQLAAPLMDAMERGTLVPLEATGRELAMSALNWAPAFALFGALWSVRAFLRRVARDDIWSARAMGRLSDAALWVLFAGWLSLTLAPTLRSALAGFQELRVSADPMSLMLCGLGIALWLAAGLLNSVAAGARDLRREWDGPGR